MISSIYITFDHLKADTGAGAVCLHEIEALKSVSDLKQVISRSDIQAGQKYDFNPFLYDYFASELIKEPVDIAHLSCSPGNAIINRLLTAYRAGVRGYTRILVNMPAHNLKLSIEEHERNYGAGTYPFKHNTDPVLWSLLTKHTRERADVIITPSKGSAAWIAENLKPKGRIQVIPHGTHIPGAVAPLPDEFAVGYLGAFGPDKGLMHLFNAWDSLASDFYKNSVWHRVPVKDAKIILAGDCCKFMAFLNPHSTTINHSDYKLLGRVANVSDFYNAISVYCQPSVSEGFGMEVPEAMAHGRPCIVSEGAGSSDCVTDGYDGFIVPIRDPKAIANRIQFFRDNPSQIRVMGERARQKAANYSWDKIEEQYRKLYEEL